MLMCYFLLSPTGARTQPRLLGKCCPSELCLNPLAFLKLSLAPDHFLDFKIISGAVYIIMCNLLLYNSFNYIYLFVSMYLI